MTPFSSTSTTPKGIGASGGSENTSSINRPKSLNITTLHTNNNTRVAIGVSPIQTRRRSSNQPTTPKSSRSAMESWLKSPSQSTRSRTITNSNNNTKDTDIATIDTSTTSTTTNTNTEQSPVTTSSFFSASRSTRSNSSMNHTLCDSTTTTSTKLNPIHETNENESENEINTTNNNASEQTDSRLASSSMITENVINTRTESLTEKEKSECNRVQNTKNTDKRCTGQTPPNKGIERKTGSERVVKRRLINKYSSSGGNVSNAIKNTKSKTPQPRVSSSRNQYIPKSENNIRTLLLSGSKKRKRTPVGADGENNGNGPAKKCCSKSLQLDHLATNTNNNDNVSTLLNNNFIVGTEKENNNNDIQRQGGLIDKEGGTTIDDDDVFITTTTTTTTTTPPSSITMKNILQELPPPKKDLLDIAEDGN